MFVLEYNCTKGSVFMKEIFQNKFLIGVAIIFWLSLFVVVTLQTRVETRNQEAFNQEVSFNK